MQTERYEITLLIFCCERVPLAWGSRFACVLYVEVIADCRSSDAVLASIHSLLGRLELGNLVSLL